MSALGFPECEGSHLPREARHGEPDLPVVSGTGTDHARLLLQVRQSDSRTLSDLALELVNGPRAAEYDEPERNLERIGAAWGAVLGIESIPGWQVCLCMAALKVVRAGHKATDDSLIDSVGYLELARRLRPDG